MEFEEKATAVDMQEELVTDNDSFNDSFVTIEFSKPVKYNGDTYTSLTFDFESLTAQDDLAIESELQAIGKMALVPSMSGEYIMRMAARACTEKMIGYDFFEGMSMRDFIKVKRAARNFLLQSE